MAKRSKVQNRQPYTNKPCKSIDLGALQSEYETSAKGFKSAGKALERAQQAYEAADQKLMHAERALKAAMPAVLQRIGS